MMLSNETGAAIDKVKAIVFPSFFAIVVAGVTYNLVTEREWPSGLKIVSGVVIAAISVFYAVRSAIPALRKAFS